MFGADCECIILRDISMKPSPISHATIMIEPERVRRLNSGHEKHGRYALYWMQASQRAHYNHALEYAILRANELNLPVVTMFGITSRFPEANARHYAFMLEGLRELEGELDRRGIQLVVLKKPPVGAVAEMAGDAALVVTDRGYLRVQKSWRERVASKLPCSLVQVESDVAVPVGVASQKEEYAAATIRPKIRKHLKKYLRPLKQTPVKRDSLGLRFGGFAINDVSAALRQLRVGRSVERVSAFKGGTSHAKRLLRDFIEDKLQDYTKLRNDPSVDCVSHMSLYLHFGQISPLYVALQIARVRDKSAEAKEAYLEELIVRRELSMNFVHHNGNYDSFDALPNWARETLATHRRDKRKYVYTLKELEGARTHDGYWNAAQKEMLVTGKMHNYMRMYWGKKILEWTATPEKAFRIALYLNNKYELDGRDPNSFAGVAWCFGKHDRPWPERPVFGKVRYMSASGLRRKFDMAEYVRNVEAF